MAKVCKVLIVDDSKSMGQFLTMIMGRDARIEVVGHALDPYQARDMIKQLNPDVLTLDVEMPRMDGITFLRNLMRLHPMPVVMLSSLTSEGAEVTLDALAIGAVDFLLKQKPTNADDMTAYAQRICDTVCNAARSTSHVGTKPGAKATSPHRTSVQLGLIGRSQSARPASNTLHRVVAIGASTGGPAAVSDLLETLELSDSCGVLSQHMPPHFMAAYAQRLDHVGSAHVVVPADGDLLQPGNLYVAPGDRHLLVRRHNGALRAFLSDGPKVQDHRPAVDVMFKSVADAVGASSVGVLLTGMGQDGAEGLCCIRRTGGLTIAQDEASSVVWGMPGSAVKAGGVDLVEPLGAIGSLVSDLAKRRSVSLKLGSSCEIPVQ